LPLKNSAKAMQRSQGRSTRAAELESEAAVDEAR
jgi:hypothetical protein